MNKQDQAYEKIDHLLAMQKYGGLFYKFDPTELNLVNIIEGRVKLPFGTIGPATFAKIKELEDKNATSVFVGDR